VLVRLEAELGRPLREAVDLTIGTSAGAFVAAAIAHGITATGIARSFREFGPRIFPASPLNRLGQLIFAAPYSAEPLGLAIDQLLGPAAMVPMGLFPGNLAVTAVSQTASEARIYTSGLFAAVGRGDLTVKEAILSSAAAPTYFPPRRPAAETLVDGGIVANAPELVGLGLIHKVYGGALDRAHVVAVGTAGPAAGRPALLPGAFSFASWMRPSRNLLLLTLEAQEHLVVTIAADLLGPNYCKVDLKPTVDQAKVMGALDATSEAATETLAAMAEIAWNRKRAAVLALLT
jgi:uncharacterized protein